MKKTFKKTKKSLFITFEGIDGCGKSTQANLLYKLLKNKGFSVILTREPGGTKLAESIRKILLDPKNKISPLAELFLYEASRAEHVNEIILPALRAKKIVICDRFYDATVAYQGYARGLKLNMIETLNRFAAAGIKPDLTIILDIPAKEGLRRAKELKKTDRMETEKLSFYEKVRKGYLSLGRKYPQRIKIIKTEDTVAKTHLNILKLLGI